MRNTNLFLPLVIFASSVNAENIIVNSSADAGSGSLRAALMTAASSKEPTTITIETTEDISLKSGLSYEGSSPLTVAGKGQNVKIDTDATILAIHGSNHVSIQGLALQGPAGWSIENRSKADKPMSGLEVRSGTGQKSDLVVDLRDFSVSGVSGHGVHVSDCAMGSDCKDKGASISVSVFAKNVRVENTGHGRYNADGLRVDEYGEGDLTFTSLNSDFIKNGADGVELREADNGNVILNQSGGRVEANGTYCNTDIIEPTLPNPVEAEFKEGEMMPASLPKKTTPSADDGCIEFEVDLYDDGSVEAYEFEIDVEDGLDIVEKGKGSVYITMTDVSVHANDDEGLDFDEYDAGDIIGTFVANSFTDNADDGLKLSERDAGKTVAYIDGGHAKGNGDTGYLVEEEGAGDLYTMISNVKTSENDGAGIEAVQEDDGTGSAILVDVDAADGIELDGVEKR